MVYGFPRFTNKIQTLKEGEFDWRQFEESFKLQLICVDDKDKWIQ